MIDNKIHDVYNYFHGREIRWHDFHSVGINEDYYDYYYAEDGLYVLRDRIMEKYWFVEARSPAEAYKKHIGLCDDIGGAMSCFDDD